MSVNITNARSLCYNRRVRLTTNDGKIVLDFPYGSYCNNNNWSRFTDEYVEVVIYTNTKDEGGSRSFLFRRINLSDCGLKILEANCRLADTTPGKDGIIIRTYSMDTGIEASHDMRMDVVDRRGMDKDLRGRDPLLSLVNGAGETVAYTNDDIEDRKLLAFVGINLKDDESNE